MEETMQQENIPPQEVAPPPITGAKLPGSFALLKLSVAYYKEHFNTIVSVMVVPFVPQALSVIVRNTIVTSFASLLSVVASIFASIVLLGLIAGAWHAEEGVPALYKKGRAWFWPVVVVHAYVALTAIGGFFLLIVPGIYAAIALSLAAYALFADNKTGASALVESWYLVKGRWGPVLWRMVVIRTLFIVVGLVLGAAAVGPALMDISELIQNPRTMMPEFEPSPVIALIQIVVQLFVALPIATIYAAFIYRSLKAIKLASPTENDRQQIEKRVKLFMTIGLVGLVAVIVISGMFIFTTLGTMSGSGGLRLHSAVLEVLENIPGLR